MSQLEIDSCCSGSQWKDNDHEGESQSEETGKEEEAGREAEARCEAEAGCKEEDSCEEEAGCEEEDSCEAEAGCEKKACEEEEEEVDLSHRFLGVAAMPSMVFAAFAIVALLWPSPTLAASVTNRDHKVYMVTIIEGEAKQDHVLKPSLVLEGVCQKGCVIRFTDSENDEYKLDGSELVSIEDGVLYYDGPAADAASGVGDAGQLSLPRRKQR